MINKTVLVSSIMLIGLGTCLFAQEDNPFAEQPVQQHQWLQKMVGEWVAEAEVSLGPDQPTATFKTTEKTHAVGGFWIVAESHGTVMEMPIHSVLTLGYDASAKTFVGTWVDSMTSYMWQYKGELNKEGNALTLWTEGPNPSAPGQRAKFKEVIEFKDNDHKTFSSYMQTGGDDWMTIVSVEYTRKK